MFLATFAEVFGANHVTPKFHFLVHYPRMILMYGTLQHLWCMRFEAKHQYFKSIITSVRNYINVTATVAKRHQLKECYELRANSFLGGEPISLRATSSWNIARLSANLVASLSGRLDLNFNTDDTFTTTTALSYDHVQYKTDSSFVLCAVEEEEIPLFVRIQYILNVRRTWLLCCRMLISKKFNRHFCAYSVHVDHDWVIVHPGEEADHSPHDMFETDGCLFVAMRYHVPC